jgi:putative transposase
MKYTHNNTSVTLVNYHIVFCPKYRRKLLVDAVKTRLEQLIKEVAAENKWVIQALEVMPDHVHLFVIADAKTKPHMVVKRFKGKTSRFLRSEFGDLRKMPTLWTRSYFLSTAGNVSAATIKKYIEQQWNK